MKMEIKDIDRIIEMCWEDRTPFEAIEFQFGLKEQDVIKIMRRNLKNKSFKVWRERVSGRKTKHMELKNSTRFKSTHKRPIQTMKNLPNKICPVCQRSFDWRRKWKDCWEDVIYCSNRCRNRKSKR